MFPVDNPPNPWSSTAVEYLDAPEDEQPQAGLVVYEDRTQSIIASNDSPDLGFRYSVNPYRGCFHGCAYCYARPGHEYLSFGAGTDFDRRIVIKPDAPGLLARAFAKKTWKGDLVLLSGVTDCYQPLEASYKLTRRCLQVCSQYRNPVGIVTKSPLIERDIDVLTELGDRAPLSVTLSIPFWSEESARALEPWVTTPRRRMRTVERLASAGIDVGVNIAPMVPGLSETDMPAIVEAAKAAGARRAGYICLRLPSSVKDVFVQRLRQKLPHKADKVLRRIRDVRDGQLNDSRFGARMRGGGQHAEAAFALFQSLAKKHGLKTETWTPSADRQRRGQLSLPLFEK